MREQNIEQYNNIEKNNLGNTYQEIATQLKIKIGENLDISSALDKELSNFSKEVLQRVLKVIEASLRRGDDDLETEIAKETLEIYINKG